VSIIDPTHVTINDDSTTTWNDSLTNAKMMLYEVDKGITTIIKTGVASYSLSSGQSNQDVRRLSLSELKELRTELLSQISELEVMLGIKKVCVQVIPDW